MKAKILDEEALRSVSPAAISAYIRARGWRRGASFGSYSDVYSNPGSPELIVPRTDRLDDYANVISQLLSILARAEDRDELALYRDLVGADKDVIRFRAPKADDDGSIPLETGVGLVSDARNLLLAAACSARATPQAVYKPGKNKDANEYIRSVRLGQTEHGSFVVTLLAPVPPVLNVEQASLWPEVTDEPYERQVTRRLMEALQHARDAVEQTRIGDGTEAFEKAIANGVSANLCEALADAISIGSGLDVSVTWARTRPTPESRSAISFTEADALVLVEAARAFRLKAPKADVELIGSIHHLNREQTAIDGLVRLRTEVDGQSHSVRAILDGHLYKMAIQAHDEKLPVIIRGDLERFGQRWQLTNVTSMRLVLVNDTEDDDEAYTN